MANKRVEAGRGRKAGVVKSAQKPANRAFYLIIALVAVGGIAALTYAATRPKAGATRIAFDSTLPKVESHGYVMGSPSAPIEVTEFGDFECPQCGRFATLTEPDVRSRLVNTGKVRFRFIDYPLDMHRNTWNASIAAACADEQGKFWEMHDAIFAAQDQWDGEATNNPDKVLKKIGEPLVPDKAKFDQCIDTQRTKGRVQAHWQLAMSTKAPGTPTFMVGDQQIPRFLTYDEFKQTVDDAVAKGNTKPFIPAETPTPDSKAVDLKKPGA
jgi:protein-disulfide isomerase